MIPAGRSAAEAWLFLTSRQTIFLPKEKPLPTYVDRGGRGSLGLDVLGGACACLPRAVQVFRVESLGPKIAWWPVYPLAREARESGNGGAKKHIVEGVDRARNFDIIGFVLMRPELLVSAQTVFEREEPGDVDDRDYACISRLGYRSPFCML